jgi:subtilase family serine protease
MKLIPSFLRNGLFLSVSAVIFLLAIPRASAQQSQSQAQASASSSSLAQTPAVPSRITQAIDETQLVTLKGNVHPLARPEFDKGAVSDAAPVKRALLLLQRSADQETALRKLLDDQQTKDSANFHRWLTPEQFGAQFGPADADIQTITSWLTSHGFQGIKVGPGKTTIEFSGSVGQVRNAFHTDIHQFMVNGQAHLANASEAQVPAALAPIISGVYGLHNFRPKSLRRRLENVHVERSTTPGKEVTFSCNKAPCFGVAPADFAKIYNIPATVKGVVPGTGINIAIVQDSNLFISDVQQYRQLFGLPNNFTAQNIILNGPDPGVQDPTTVSGDETEADLDAELAGAIAPGATIQVVVSENSESLGAPGIDLSALYIIDNNIAPIMSESFGACETAANGVEPFYSALWEQAASQGITVVVASGDSGSDVCDSFSGLDYATTGLSVSAIASTPYNVALGGTDFSYGANSSTYWGPGTNTESALSYIPESTWNSSCAAGATAATLNTVCPAATINANSASGNFVDIAGGSGGQSAVATNPRPSWQTGITPPADAHRDIPDVSLYSAVNSGSNTFIIICEADSPFGQNGSACAISNQSISLTGVGGTSAAAPAFAGIMAMVVQQQGGDPAGRQGNANHVLYSLYNQNKSTASKVCASTAANVSTATCIFYDVVTGNNSVACQATTPNCSSSNAATAPYGVLVDPASATTPAFAAVAGYDKATGLGSVNVTNLLASWASGGQSADTVTVTSPQSGTTVAHGANASFTIKVAQNSGATVPTGDVSLLVTPAGGQPFAIGTFNNNLNIASTFTLDASGTLTFSTDLLPGGTPDSIVAQYGGDSLFAPNQSAPINITVNKESSVTTISLLALDQANGLFDLPLTTSAVYGTTPYIMRVDVSNSGGINNSCALASSVLPCPTGTITETYDSGKPLNDFPNTQTGVATNTASLNALGFLEDQPINLPGGSHTLVAAYSGDTSFNPSTSTAAAITVTAAPTTTSVAASPASGVNTSTVVTLTATVATTSGGVGPTGTVTFSSNGTSLGSPVNVVPTAASGLNSTAPVPAFATATMTHTFATAGSYTISASYSTGDANYSNSASSGAGNTTVTVTSASTGNFTVAGAAVTVTAGMSGMSNITVTPAGGFAGTVNVTCGSIPGVTCTPNPLAINITNANPVASNLTIAVAAPSSSMTASIEPLNRNVYAAVLLTFGGGKGWWTLSGATGLMALLLLALPGRKRYRAALAFGLVCVLSFSLGCGGGYGGGGGGGGGGITTTHLTVSATKVPNTGTLTVSATVTTTGSNALSGSVQFYDGATALGNPVPLSSGSTGQINLTAAQAPAFFQLIGTHTAISAKYLGDTYNAASQSGNLSITITGTTSLPITGTSGGTNANGNVSLTIN